jgi:hypothetical protein
MSRCSLRRHTVQAVGSALALLLVALWFPRGVAAARTLSERPGDAVAWIRAFSPDAPFSPTVGDDYLCPRAAVRRTPSQCPPFGPGTRAVRIAYLRSLLPEELPVLSVEQIPKPEGSVTRYLYGHIINLPAPTYRHPAEAEAGYPPVRVFQANINWASVIGQAEFNGHRWVQINRDEYISAEHIHFPAAPRFQGVALTAHPDLPFAWLRRDLRPSPTPGEAALPDLLLPRRTLVTIFATETVAGRRWNMIGPDQWIEHDWVAQVTPSARPEGVPAGVKWIDINTYEQTLAAYDGDRLVYATLITAGKSDLTPLGLFRIFRKVSAALMQSYDRPMDDIYWFHLEDVEHAQFFNDRISLHAAYWHDHFGTSRSNGCVNLAPLDARWLYGWTDPQLGSGGSWVTAESAGEGQTWVWVHHPAPDRTRKPMP